MRVYLMFDSIPIDCLSIGLFWIHYETFSWLVILLLHIRQMLCTYIVFTLYNEYISKIGSMKRIQIVW